MTERQTTTAGRRMTGRHLGGRGLRLAFGALVVAATAATAGCGSSHPAAAGAPVGQARSGAATGGTQPSAARSGAAAPRLTVPLDTGTAAPHLPPPAGQGGKVIPNGSGPSKVPVPAHVDGCDHDYGSTGQCVPWKIEGTDTAARCDWLTAHGFGPLKVHGTDRQHLDTDGNGTACDTGDHS